MRASRADLLVYFYARALQILKPGGWLAFITSNKFMRAGYGQGIRGLEDCGGIWGFLGVLLHIWWSQFLYAEVS